MAAENSSRKRRRDSQQASNESRMSVTLSTGAESLLSVGVSLGDLAIVYKQGRKFGNWFRAKANDGELFDSIGELPTSLFRRKGVVSTTKMRSRWPRIHFMYDGQSSGTPLQNGAKDDQALDEFSWLMVSTNAALTYFLPDAAIIALWVEVFAASLAWGNDGNKKSEESLKASLKAQLPVNLVSWKDVAAARRIDLHVLAGMKNCRQKKLEDLTGQKHGREFAVPQLNRAEQDELQRFLSWLMADDAKDDTSRYEFHTFSLNVFLIADALRETGIYINTVGPRKYERELVVCFFQKEEEKMSERTWFHGQQGMKTTFKTPRLRAQQISYPRDRPDCMIETLAVTLAVRNEMALLWKMGTDAANLVKLRPSAESPYSPDSDIYYKAESDDSVVTRFQPFVLMQAEHVFPEKTQSLLIAVDQLLKGQSEAQKEWLHRHTGLGYLQRQSSIPDDTRENLEIFSKYQALVFGYHYALFRPWVSFEFTSKDMYLRGIWGDGNLLFLAMCAEFGDEMARNPRGVSRTHILYMLAAMYAGRQKMYSKSMSQSGLLGTLGTISVLSKSLLRISDVPADIAMLAVVDLPIIDLISENNGELYSEMEVGIDTFPPVKPPTRLTVISPFKHWSVHPKMGVLFGESDSGVLMAASCEGTLVGWFNPLAADVMFLSSAYLPAQEDVVQDRPNQGYVVDEEHWQNGLIPRTGPADEETPNQVVLVQSRACPALRYAATGFYAAIGEELAIATNDVNAAIDRIELQGAGVVIA